MVLFNRNRSLGHQRVSILEKCPSYVRFKRSSVAGCGDDKRDNGSILQKYYQWTSKVFESYFYYSFIYWKVGYASYMAMEVRDSQWIAWRSLFCNIHILICRLKNCGFTYSYKIEIPNLVARSFIQQSEYELEMGPLLFYFSNSTPQSFVKANVFGPTNWM